MEKKINREVIRTGDTDIKVHLIDSFPNHPYHVFDDEYMTELAASIEANGLLFKVANRSWCSYKDCSCRKYIDGQVTYEEICEGYDSGEFLC